MLHLPRQHTILVSGWLLLILPCSGQEILWEQLMQRGQTALAYGALPEAEAAYRAATELAEQFPTDDLRRATSLRDLAQVQARLGNLVAADSLTHLALTTARRTLSIDHPYVRSLLDDITRLETALAAREPIAEQTLERITFEDRIENLGLWMLSHLTLHSGGTLPLSNTLTENHSQGLTGGANLHVNLVGRQDRSLQAVIGRHWISLPEKNPRTPSYQLRTNTLALATDLGRFSLHAGSGYLLLVAGADTSRTFGFFGGAAVTLVRWQTQLLPSPLELHATAEGTYLPAARPISIEPFIWLQVGLAIGLQ
jgi:hypothetical protein